MPLSKITTNSISDDAVTSAKLVDGFDFSGNEIALPSGTTAQRPSSPSAGSFRYNSTLLSIEFWNGNSWLQTHLVPVVSSASGKQH